jgi:predicted nucleic acid-binding protein
MEQNYLIDTNVIIDYFGDKLPQEAKVFLNSFEPIVSAVTKIEVLGWLNATREQLYPLNAFMDLASILSIDETVISKTISIRQSKKIALGDAIIAATAFTNGLILISRNTKDFENIAGLNVVNPYEF